MGSIFGPKNGVTHRSISLLPAHVVQADLRPCSLNMNVNSYLFLFVRPKSGCYCIYELELFPVLVALRTWQHHLENAQVVFYLDNDAARSALIPANGSTLLSQAIIAEFLRLERDTCILPWFSRVPTASNPADDASRLIFNVPWLLGSQDQN